MISIKVRNKITRNFGEDIMFNKKTKIPIADVWIASLTMGKNNQEIFWKTLIKEKNERKKDV